MPKEAPKQQKKIKDTINQKSKSTKKQIKTTKPETRKKRPGTKSPVRLKHHNIESHW